MAEMREKPVGADGAGSQAYEIWQSLGSPRYICAPMVEMSELSFRTLVRRHGTQLCFTPMFHAAKFVTDPIYRSQMFITCSEDRPLIVQFCANDAEMFAEAAALVQDHCDGVDLNLGCPQTIAKRGHYGSFLQEDLPLVYEMVHRASQRVHIPISCKVRILSDLQKTIAYAQMIEQAGAKFLTVHGRTRDQKGHATGLADWDVIRSIKSHVSIPVVANGNIVNFSDVQRCLAYTGCDAVMSAEGILQNPALFSGQHPPVWEIVEEFLSLCGMYPTEHGHIRTHLFRMLAHCLPHSRDLQDELARANSLEKCESVCKLLREKLVHLRANTELSSAGPASEKHRGRNIIGSPPQTVSSGGSCGHSDTSHELPRAYGLQLGNESHECDFDTLGDDDELLGQRDAALVDECAASSIGVMGDGGIMEVPSYRGRHARGDEPEGCEHRPPQEDQGHPPVHTLSLQAVSTSSSSSYELPIWLCHARPRVAKSGIHVDNKPDTMKQEDATVSGVGALSLNETTEDISALHPKRLPRSQKKKLKIQQRLEGQKLRRQRTKDQKKERKRTEQQQSQVDGEPIGDVNAIEGHTSKRDRMDQVRERCLAAMSGGQRVCVDLSMECLMSHKECSKLAQQLCRLYGSNRKSEQPFHIYFTGLQQDGFLHQECKRKCQGFENYLVDVHYVSHTEVFSLDEIVYLSPDSPNVLQSVDDNKVYIIGGLIDESIQKGVTQDRAEKVKICTARLPIDEYMERAAITGFNFKKVLAVNQVFDILMTYKMTEDWRCALTAGMPPRQGYTLKGQETPAAQLQDKEEIESADVKSATTPSKDVHIHAAGDNDIDSDDTNIVSEMKSGGL